ncbi:flagellar biosynthetic protein FliQ [Humitalea rosea]|uniref:Flagellar biosynthetic protein FliQ n=1 Tax=Humitalea rosea TaxID=990373 RepID=A0A2W7K141_9PROT|nr:flagellar biosynthetic protein FliQ [Humitalea rosea]PZW41310.1 flagellar biosynthetic protein FliQ [Humitalea rosea]
MFSESTGDALAASTREAMWVLLQIAAPPLLALLAIGLVVSVFQALTQIQEASLAFLPKLVATGAVLLLMGPFMTGVLRAYTEGLFDRIIAIGGAG